MSVMGDYNVQDEIQAGLQYVFQTNSKYTLLVSGTGHAGDHPSRRCMLDIAYFGDPRTLQS